MNHGEQYGESTEWDLLVQRIREMPDEGRDQELRMAQSRGYDAGWLDGVDHAIRMTRDETKAIRRQHLERLSRTYRTWRRRFMQDAFCGLLIVSVPALALYLISKGG